MKTIMIVDDSPSVRTLVRLLLEDAGFHVVEAVHGIDCLVKLKEVVPDLFLLDVNMPELNGLDLLEKLRSISVCKFKPILMLTTKKDSKDILTAKKFGARGWIIKPFDEEELLKTVKMFLR